MSRDIKKHFRAFRIHQDSEGIRAGIERLCLDDLTAGEVVIQAHYSGVNYKDALAATGKGKILRRSPLVGGVDVAGIVVSSEDESFKEGDAVLVSGCGLSEVYDGGFSEYVRVPSDCVVEIPRGLSLYESMVMGTPALTAALALHRMEANGQHPDNGAIIVTGASGGVGNLVVDLFSKRGYQVVALTSKNDASIAAHLQALGAMQVITSDELTLGSRPLEKACWAGAVDMLGGEVLAYLTRTVNEMGNIASIGLAGGAQLQTTVMPFILRGVNILGVSSTNCPCQLRRDLWGLLANDWKPQHLSEIAQAVISLDELPDVFERMLDNKTHGRVIVSQRGI